jgi:hypothetical protein
MMTLLEAILEEMDRLGLDNATGINVCELIDRHNIEVAPLLDINGNDVQDDFIRTWRENQ